MSRSLPILLVVIFILIIFSGGVGSILIISKIIKPTSPLGDNLLSTNPVTSKPVSVTLNLADPEDNSLVFEPDLLLQGQTIANGVIIVGLNNTLSAFEAQSSGNFSSTLKLQEGANYLTVSVYDLTGNSKTEERTIFYSKEKL